jgi:hypothetical protein
MSEVSSEQELRGRGGMLCGSLAAGSAFLICFGVVLNPPLLSTLFGSLDFTPATSESALSGVAAAAVVPSSRLDGGSAEFIHAAALPERAPVQLAVEEPRSSTPEGRGATELISEVVQAQSGESTIQALEHTSSHDQVEPLPGVAQVNLSAPSRSAGTIERSALSNEDLLQKGYSYSGVWGADASACSAKHNKKGMLPTLIDNDGAWAGDTFCKFKNKKQTAAGWDVVASCSDTKERWTARVKLKVQGNQLTWTSQRGAQTYVRCERGSMVATAQALPR